MPSTYLPLRWESTGDQWWFASPIDWAAANAHYDVVRELLYIDPNLLIKLTSLPRIRRLETVWDDDQMFGDVAKCRAHVAQKLFWETQTQTQTQNSLIRGGYGGWLLYTAASAGDVAFVKELLDRDPCLVFGEGEYGVTDVLYAAARSRNSEVFRLLFDRCLSHVKGASPGFRSEMMNRAVHAAARGGNLEMLVELFGGADVLAFRDARGSTVLHSAAGRAQIEVVKHLISTYDIINSVDNRGNTALNVSAYRGHLSIVDTLLSTSPSLASLSNNYGDTLLHMAIAGFICPGFRRLDRQLELMKQLVGGKLVNMEDIINVQNNEGRTALHVAVVENIPSNVVELLMSVPCIDLNIRDHDGNTPLDLLKRRPQSASSEMLIKRLISAGGIEDPTTRIALVSHLRRRGIGGSPGTSFRVPDSEMFLYTDAGWSSSEIEIEEVTRKKKLASATKRLTNLLRFPKKKTDGDGEYASDTGLNSPGSSPMPLRHQFARASSLPTNKRIQSLRAAASLPSPSPSTKKKFTTGLTQGVLQLLPNFGSPSSESTFSSPASADQTRGGDDGSGSASVENLEMKGKQGSLNMRLNNYLCFGAQGVAIDNSITSPQMTPTITSN